MFSVALKNFGENALTFRVQLLILVFLYIVLLHVGYVNFTVKVVSYLSYTDPGFPITLLMYVLAFLPLAVLPVSLNKSSHMALWILYLIVYVPACFYPIYNQSVSVATAAVNVFFLFFSLMIMVLFSRLPRIVFNFPALTPRFIVASLVILFVIGLVMLGYQFSHVMHFASLSDVYLQRKLFAGKVHQAPMIFGYLIQWIGGIFCPFFVVYGILYKKKLFWILGFLGALLVYAIAAYKSYLFQLLIIPFAVIYLVYTRYSLRALLLAILLFISLFTLIDWVLSTSFFTTLLVRRIFVIPGFLTGKYWQFFSHNSYSYFSNSILKVVLPKQYPQGVTYAIGHWFAHRNMDADANIFASAYSALGNVGVIIIAVLAGIYLWIYDSLTRHYHALFGLLLVVMLSFRFAESSFTVTLFTGGGVLLLFMLYFCNGILKNEQTNSSSNNSASS